MVTAGKGGALYLVDRDNLGKFNPNSDQIVQEFPTIFKDESGEHGNLSARSTTTAPSTTAPPAVNSGPATQ